MRLSLRGRLLAAALVVSAAPIAVAPPAAAQVSISISFDSFHDRLARYGDWVYSDRWGTVWQPADVPGDFRPYDTGGHWEYTGDYGWTWVSDYDWGDVAFHYGRWVYDPDDGWLWMPGYVWSPAWVVWRGNNDYLGWMPMPPDDNFLGGRGDIGVSVSWDDPDRYYNRWYGSGFGGYGSMWVFVNYGHIADRDYHRYAVPRTQAITLVTQTRNITNYTVVNNYVVNKSVDVRRVEQVTRRQIRPVSARQVFKNPGLISTVSHGDEVRAQMINVAPRGMGKPNSAPPPSPAMINKLSDHATARGAGRGGQPTHLFTKSALSQPDAAKHFRGGGANTGGGTQGPAFQQQQSTGGPAGNGTARGDHRMDRMNGAGPRNAGPNTSGPDNAGPTNENGAAIDRKHHNGPPADTMAPAGGTSFNADHGRRKGPAANDTLGSPQGAVPDGTSGRDNLRSGGPSPRGPAPEYGRGRRNNGGPDVGGASPGGPDAHAMHQNVNGAPPDQPADRGGEKARGENRGDRGGPEHHEKPKKEDQGGPPQ